MSQTYIRLEASTGNGRGRTESWKFLIRTRSKRKRRVANLTSCTLHITYHRKYLRLHTSCEPSFFTLATTGRTSACLCSLCSSRGATPISVLVMPFRILPAPLHTRGPRRSHSFQAEFVSVEEVSSKSPAQHTYPAAVMARRHTGRWSRGGAEREV